MPNIWLSSDFHFGHDREFIWGPRGFNSIEEHDEEIVKRYNAVVSDEDDVYVLGDLMLGNNNHGIECINRLKGKLHVIFGNHDTDARKTLYKMLPNVVETADALRFKYNKYHFYCSHYPTITSNLEKESLKQVEINLYGHTHQINEFYEDRPFMYHVGVDSNNCHPVLIDDVISRCENKVIECIEYL